MIAITPTVAAAICVAFALTAAAILIVGGILLDRHEKRQMQIDNDLDLKRRREERARQGFGLD